MSEPVWEFWIDVGGTFTDCFGRAPDGTLRRHKLLSSGVTKGNVDSGSNAKEIRDPSRRGDPQGFWNGYELRLLDRQGRVAVARAVAEFDSAKGALYLESPLDTAPLSGQSYELVSGEEAPLIAIRYLLGLGKDKAIPRLTIRLGTTRGTNALITRTGAPTALVTTRGFKDILRIGYQNRPRLFDLAIQKPEPLYRAVVEIDERITAEGEVLQAPNEEQIIAQLRDLESEGIHSLAISLLNGYVNAEHEKLVERAAREIGFHEISTSSHVAPLIKIVSRGDTTVVDAYLNPVLRSYVERLCATMKEADLRIMTSSGGLVTAKRFAGKDSILSGPAGGVVGFARAAQAAGFQHAIGFDMGGTSTDVSRFDGRFEYQYETEKAGVRLVAPMMAIETVAAGGGSICRFDGIKLVVGPSSAGADPGPACYGRGGPLTVTDVNLYLGRILAERFPFPVDHTAVDRKVEKSRRGD